MVSASQFAPKWEGRILFVKLTIPVIILFPGLTQKGYFALMKNGSSYVTLNEDEVIIVYLHHREHFRHDYPRSIMYFFLRMSPVIYFIDYYQG